MNENWFKVLSLDGGGSRGNYTVGVLTKLKSILDEFDLIAGTSTGGILALALACEKDLAEIAAWYVTRPSQIFKKGFGYKIKSLFGIRYGLYPNDGLIQACKDFFGDIKLGEVKKHVLLTGYETTEATCCIIDSNDPKWKDLYVWECAVITSSAPVYFPTFKREGLSFCYIDGGMYAGSPADIANNEAIKIKRKKGEPETIYLLSIGTGYRTSKYDVTNWGIFNWIFYKGENPLSQILLQTQKMTDHYGLNLKQNDLMRFDVVDKELNESIHMDETDSEKLASLYNIGFNEPKCMEILNLFKNGIKGKTEEEKEQKLF